ncbi:MAG: PAS domain-containing protein, partial [Promethearchaeota archaeon]
MRQEINREKIPPIVAIGASAGGLEAFEQFFSNMPEDNGMAFVLIPHLDPTHKSILSEIIMQYTRMQVVQVSDGVQIEPNKVYIIAPNHYMTISHGILKLAEIQPSGGLRLPIDHFFRSLASDQREKAIGIVLSGTGSDGTLGIRDIKGEGGIAMIQDPVSAKYDPMPRSAINNSIVDYVLPPDKMPEYLIKYVQNRILATGKDRSRPPITFKDQVQEIFNLIKTKTKHDFSVYKENTMLRRIERRMAINHINKVSDYIKYIEEYPHELDVLFKEFLIGVTNFFRDKEAFKVLEQKIIPLLFQNNKLKKKIRVWVPGCSTGEEAYSIAILLQEYIEKFNSDIEIQIFATDIDDTAIERGRLGIYPDNIAADVPADHLKKYFVLEGNRFQIKKKIRDNIVFAVQNVIKDPPFSKVDLISCRNLLIYLNAEIQKKLLVLFHYSLNTGGFLFLGNSESINIPSLYSEINKKWKIFQRNEVPSFLVDFPRPFPPLIDYDVNRIPKKELPKKDIISYRQLMERFLLKIYSPPSVIINEKGTIFYIQGETNRFLEIQSGDVKMNIFQMAKEPIKLKLSTAVRRALSEKKEIIYEKITLKADHGINQINLRVTPILKPESLKDLLIVSFEETPLLLPVKEDNKELDKSNEYVVKELEDELHTTKQHLQTTIEEYETTTEELQSANEELQSTNEELQTSKEELQSVNEELITVNNELEAKITELRKLNNDMKNLILSSNIGTIFLDENLIIQRFTPASKKMLNLIESDIGRPLHHISSNLLYDNLIKDAEEVLKTLIPKEIDLQIKDNGWFNMRILPYRTEENAIKGVVITFFDITKRYLLAQEKDDALQLVESIVETIRNPLIVLDRELKVIRVNKAFYDLFKIPPREVIDKYLYDLGNKQWDIPKLRNLLNEIIKDHSMIKDFEIEHNFDIIGKKTMLLNAKEIIREKNKSLILLAIEDITAQKEFEKNLIVSKEAYKEAFNRAELLKDLFIHDMTNILQIILSSNEIISQILDKPEEIDNIKKYNSIIFEQIRKAQELADKIRLISKIDNMEKNNHPLKVKNVLEESITYLKKTYKNKNFNIKIHGFDKNLSIFANELISEAIGNIFINAIKHNDKEIIK